MGGDLHGWYFPSLDGGSRTLVLLGCTGNGKSATGNSILGKPAFVSRKSLSSVTSTAECQTTKFANGEVVNVIDTPGLFDLHVGSESISKEIVRCIDLANDGIHAILLVLSVSVRFTEEEASVIKSLKTVFGPKVTEYMMVVFTGGDTLDQSLEDFLSQGCPDALKDMLHMCKNRMVLFDNKTKNKIKKESQLRRLISLVDKVVEENGGQPYTNNLFSEMREGSKKHQQQKEELNVVNGRRTEEEQLTEMMERIQKSYDEQLKRMMELVVSKLMEKNERLWQQLAEEKSARLNAEKIAHDAQKQSEDDIQKLEEKLDEIQKLKEKLDEAKINELQKLWAPGKVCQSWLKCPKCPKCEKWKYCDESSA